jgi:uncharacterized membrane protein YdbT with pleckstrin-like domain
MSYENLHLDPEEKVILEVRKHWIVFAGIAVGLLSTALLPLGVFVLIKIFVPSVLVFDLPGNDSAFYIFLYILWILTMWILFFVDWTKYYLDVWYVTEKRIIAVDQKNIFNREISNLRFDKIQDVTIGVRGFIPTMLDFGDVRVQTASEDNLEFVLNVVRHPENVKKVIFERQNKINERESNTQPSGL